MTNQEINEAVAKKLGEDVREGSIFIPGGDWGEEMDESKPIPDYSGSIQAAWEIWEHIGSKTEWSIAIEYQGNGCECWLSHPTERQIIIQADTAPMAICEAFLKLP